MEVKLDIFRDYAQIVRERLTDNIGHRKSSVDEIQDDDGVVRAYFRVLRRLVSNVPRTISKANDFVCPPEHTNALSKIESKIQKGENITPYLSRQILNISYNDPLLNEWGIQHLHLGKSMSKNPKHRGLLVEGTEQLLYVYFDEECAYFIKILGHGTDFANQLLIQTMHDNWPDVLKPHRVAGTVYPDDLTSTDRYRLRKANLSAGMVTVSDGTSYGLIGGALMLSGDNILDVMRVDQLRRWAHYLKDEMITKMPAIVSELNERGLEIVEPIVLRLGIEDETDKQCFLLDDNNRLEIPIPGPWISAI